jgi:hypothetical protein
VTRRLTVAWPDPRPFEDRGDNPIRILAASDEPDPALDHEQNRVRLGPVDAVVGCGDLPADYLAFLADAFRAPLVRVLGNHDRLEVDAETGVLVAEPVRGRLVHVAPVPIVGLSWPGTPPRRSELTAWRQTVRLALGEAGRGRRPIVASHIPPRGAGDVATDGYHRGSPAYRWLLDRLRPPLWLHGHTPLAGVETWSLELQASRVVNVTGSVLVELVRQPA